MHDPRREHMHAPKRSLRYVQGSLHFRLHLNKSSIGKLVSDKMQTLEVV